MGKTEEIARSVARMLGDEGLVEKLAALKPSELTSLLLAVNRAHSTRRTFASAREHPERDEMFRRSTADGPLLRTVEDAFFVAATTRAFEIADLGPVVPLGLAALTGIDPNNALGALRGAELLADPTAAMALEVASRRHHDRATTVRLASSSRALRMQPLPKFAEASRHFRLLALVTSAASREAERAALLEHVVVWLAMLEELAARGFSTSHVRLELTQLGAHDVDDAGRWRDEELFPSLRARFPRVALIVDSERTQGRGYYQGWMLHLTVRDARGEWIALGDGGVVPWTGRMIGDRRERVVTSGFGAELLVKRGAPSTSPPRLDDGTSIRRATSADAARLLAILTTPSVAARWPDWDEDEVARFIAGDGDAEAFAIVRDGLVVGAIQTSANADPEYLHGGLDMFLDEAARGEGVAEAAIAAASRLLFDRGHHRIVIDPARDNIAARRVYARCGFRTVGVLEQYERNAGGHGFHDGVLMELMRTGTRAR